MHGLLTHKNIRIPNKIEIWGPPTPLPCPPHHAIFGRTKGVFSKVVLGFQNFGYYFSTLGVKAKVICGLFKGPHGNAFPQVFLDIDGHIIEHSFTHLEEGWTPHRNMKVFVKRFSQRKLISNYVRDSPSASKLAVIGKELLGEEFSQDDVDYLEFVCKTDLNQNIIVNQLIVLECVCMTC